MKKIEKENGKIYDVEIEEYYGSTSIKKILIGTYDENEEIEEEKPKSKKRKKSN